MTCMSPPWQLLGDRRKAWYSWETDDRDATIHRTQNEATLRIAVYVDEVTAGGEAERTGQVEVGDLLIK
jgi:hypothetical protein